MLCRRNSKSEPTGPKTVRVSILKCLGLGFRALGFEGLGFRV